MFKAPQLFAFQGSPSKSVPSLLVLLEDPASPTRRNGAVRAGSILAAGAEQRAVREIMIFLHSHGVGTARAVRTKVPPEQAGGGFGVSFEFDDGWLEACVPPDEKQKQSGRLRA